MKKPSMISILLFLTGLLSIIALIFFNRTTLHQILTTEKEVDTISEQITAKHDEVKQDVEKYTTAIETDKSNINRKKQKQNTNSRNLFRIYGIQLYRPVVLSAHYHRHCFIRSLDSRKPDRYLFRKTLQPAYGTFRRSGINRYRCKNSCRTSFFIN